MREHKRSQDVTCDATARGIAQCLRMLADEAASLDLSCTARALWSAIRICERESRRTPVLATPESPQPSAAPLN